jgi:L-asparaginase
MNMRIIATGGTFDKHYDPISGQLVFTQSVIPAALSRARLTGPVSFEPLLALDSLDMHDKHRQQICAACISASEDRIVIVHGTDTAQQTAEVLGHAALKKTIVITGAMVPYEITNSDAFFNLGFALAAARLLPVGVYVAMHAEIFTWNEVQKNRAAGMFERSQ